MPVAAWPPSLLPGRSQGDLQAAEALIACPASFCSMSPLQCDEIYLFPNPSMLEKKTLGCLWVRTQVHLSIAKATERGLSFQPALSCRLSQKFRNYWRFQCKQVLEPLMEIQGAPSCGYCSTLQHFLDLTPSWMGSFPSISYHLLTRFLKDYM